MKKNVIGLILGLFIAAVLGLAGCGGDGGGGEAAPIDTVSGIVSAAGEVLSGTVYLTDSASPPRERFTSIATDGSYSFDVTGMTKPYQLKAFGTANGQYYNLYAEAADKGITNINTDSGINSPDNNTNGTVQGVVRNPQTDTALAGAKVNAYLQSEMNTKTLAATATTGVHGEYAISGLIIGTSYYLEFVKSGYTVLTYYNVNPAKTALELQNVMLIPEAWQSMTATVSGKVKSASTNTGLPDMTVKVRPGIANRNGSTITATAVTDANGTYTFSNLAVGSYTAEVTGRIGSTPIITAHFTLVSSYNNTTANRNQDFPVTTPFPSSEIGQYRIVLNWGNNPSDLDSHLTGPTGTAETRFHTAFYNEDYPRGTRIAGGNTEVFLDIDKDGHGYYYIENTELYDNSPETTTIVSPHSGTYRFYVHHFAGSSTISTSGAKVEVYKGESLLATFTPPFNNLGVDAVWSVFSMDVGPSGEIITPINVISMINSKSLPKVAEPSSDEYYFFREIPRNK